MYEILSGRQPFFQSDDFAVMFHVRKGRRPSRPQGNVGKLFTDDIWEILELCWRHQPGDRMSAKDVLSRLERVQSPLRLPFGADGGTETNIGDVLPKPGTVFSSVPGSLLIFLRVAPHGFPPRLPRPMIPQDAGQLPDPSQTGNLPALYISLYLNFEVTTPVGLACEEPIVIQAS